MSVLVVGYGINNSGRSGVRTFGHTPLEDFHVGWIPVEVSKGRVTNYAGPFAEYEYDEGEVATAPGDSGGPDFAPIRSIDPNGNEMWIPAIVAVHSCGEHNKDIDGDGEDDIPTFGKETWGTIITDVVAATIKSVIPPAPAPTLVLEQIKVIEDGDDTGAGDWHFTVELNGLRYTYDRDFNESTHTLGLRFNLGWTDQVDIAFYGEETDEGFMNPDDHIKRWGDRITLPTRPLTLPRSFSSGVIGGEGDDVEYELFFSIVF